MKKTMWAAAAAGSALLLGAGAAAAADQAGSPFSTVVVFGDSLSDNGDIAIASGLPPTQKFTTNPGEVAAEIVASHYGFDLKPSLAGGTDFAFGGAGVLSNSPGTPAGVPTLSAQINGYLAAHPSLDRNGLYSYWGGANDIFFQATQVAGGAAT
jgi:outer membrane lipase/esterase